MLKRLISGGQTGADSCIVAVGRQLGVAIGGEVPKGWLTEQGPAPRLRGLGFTESASADYAVRTRHNVEQADATLVFASVPDSDGTRLTLQHAQQLGRPYLLVNPFLPHAEQSVRDWLTVIRPQVLNVAGNRESKSPGIAAQAARVLYRALRDQPVLHAAETGSELA